MKKISISICIALASLALISCSHYTQDNPPPSKASAEKLSAHLVSKSGSKVTGHVDLIKSGDSVILKVTAVGLKPNSEHGFHIHEFGDCSASDATTAGDHFAGRNSKHGTPNVDPHHSGDLGNIKADAQGRVDKEATYSFIKFSGPESVVGRSIIIHEKPDDLTSQPSGNAGKRFACGVIGISKQ